MPSVKPSPADGQVGFRVHHDRLRDVHGVAEVWRSQIVDADQTRLADMHRRAVYRRVAGGDAHRVRHQPSGDGAHGHHHLPGEGAGGLEVDVGEVHRHVHALVDVGDRHAVVQRRLLEGEGTADQERDGVVGLVGGGVRRFVDKRALRINAVGRDVGADVAPASSGEDT